ncbi:MAG TPA: uracil-DNA glycosylase [Lacunisphaera sp.]|nr:uracil-DNA glycosylase [Lacunisphaera sp.]
MSAREHLEALHEELRRLKAEGLRTVAVTEESLDRLRSAVTEAKAGQGAPEPEPAAPAAPSPRTGRAPAPAAAGAALPDEPPVVVLPPGDKATRWAALREFVLNHPVCRAHVRPGKKVVLGVGSLDARIFFCGEAPGADEEVQGEPFVGPAGQLLTKMIQAMGLRREDVYIGNIMNWRPEMPVSGAGVQIGNRPPTPEEMNFCLPFLRAQLDIVQPQLIVALGATAAGGLLGAGTFRTLGEIKGRWHEFNGRPVMVTYHPSYILRNNSNRSKRGIWEDLLKVMERAGLPVSDRQRGYFLDK